MENLKLNRTLFAIGMFVVVFVTQVFLGRIGHYIASVISYGKIDPYDAFAGISIHHIVQMVLALIIITVLGKLLKIDFYLKPGDVARGKKYLITFTSIFALIAVALHVFMYINNQLPVYTFPLDKRNVLGTLGFQLLISGTSEEIVFRALPVTMLVYAFGKSIPVKGHVTLEVILASILFSLAHTKWSLMPFKFEMDTFQIVYSFILGTIQGVVYQKSKSIVYPMLMHNISNFLMVGMGYLFTALKAITS
ncbi:MAG TPA: CPBP family intramembrane metalloprotease [Mesotoga sp.]|nr:CPBP family intramembrane metalloprotease [Mesotoga sp.]MDD5744290.1 CPBP family intramembrane metalloprotease [Mesotoga sp.]HOI63801.1 CPBP family intramembrane metalloprotease [Mesotoga sp.]HPB62449.1 CPBP family intramembrane metalloprotease [Mesotoga sp.]HPI16297.1 CPBP family intramembrane metalloprotease [Mesotoga sp.]